MDNRPTRKQLKRKITVDDVGTTLVVGDLSKEDLQILVNVLADDVLDLKSRLKFSEARSNGRAWECPGPWGAGNG